MAVFSYENFCHFSSQKFDKHSSCLYTVYADLFVVYDMFAQELRTDNTSGLSNTKEYIVLHHTATDAHSLQGVLRHLTKGPVSCHYVIDTS